MDADDWKYAIAVFLIVAVLVAPLAFFAGRHVGSRQTQTQAPAASDEQLSYEYYRGLYDMCVYFGTHTFGETPQSAQPVCSAIIAKAHQAEWYVQPSQGYTGPATQGEACPTC